MNYWLVCALAIAVHAIVDNKYVGHFVMVVYYVLLLFASQLGLEHNLYKFGNVPAAVYSDMNGYGHFLPRVRAFQAYWGAASLLLLVVALLFWSRGTASSWRERLAAAKERLDGATLGVAGAALLAFVALGGFIFYNTNVLNRYETPTDRQALQAEYEKRYKPLGGRAAAEDRRGDAGRRPLPARAAGADEGHATRSRTSPASRSAGCCWRSRRPTRLVVHQLDIGVPSRLEKDDVELGVRALPARPAAARRARRRRSPSTSSCRRTASANEGSNTAVVYNGSFINGRAMLPLIGYQDRGELERDQDRKKFGLAPKERMRDRDDPAGLQVNGLQGDADFIAFEATVSTEPDQIAISPGYLQREWTENGRRYFHYKMDAPILNFYAFQSARYAVKKDAWAGPAGNVAIEIYYQPGHEFDLDSMNLAVKDALAYCSAAFGPYPVPAGPDHRVPALRDLRPVVPEHHPVLGGDRLHRPGPARRSEGHRLPVLRHRARGGAPVVGAPGDRRRRAGRHDAGRVAGAVLGADGDEEEVRRRPRCGASSPTSSNSYLRGRAFEQKKELPLSRVENQPYIHYNKGSLVFYALQDYIGEDKLNQAIRTFRDAHAFKGPPYPSSEELVQRIREVTPPELQYLVDDLFEKIVVYDNRAVSATMKQLAGGKWEVTMKVVAKKRVADELGKESDVALDDLIDIGVIDEKGDAIAVEQQAHQGRGVDASR